MPDRGWGYQAVRVCKPCYSATVDGVLDVSGPNTEPNEVQVRKVGETVVGTVTSLATALEFPINVIKDSARYTVTIHTLDIFSIYILCLSAGPTTGCPTVRSASAQCVTAASVLGGR